MDMSRRQAPGGLGQSGPTLNQRPVRTLWRSARHYTLGAAGHAPTIRALYADFRTANMHK